MAEVLTEFVRTRRHYPWEKWANGKVWRAVAGTDFKCSPAGFKSALYNHARRSGLSVRVSQKAGDNGRITVDFQFTAKGRTDGLRSTKKPARRKRRSVAKRRK